MTSIAFSFDQPIVDLGGNLQLIIEIAGESSLEFADLHNVTAVVDGSDEALGPPRRAERKEQDGSIVAQLEFPFAAPTKAGTYSVTMDFPGINKLQDYFAVLDAK